MADEFNILDSATVQRNGVLVEALSPEDQAKHARGEHYPYTFDADGNLQVVLPEWTELQLRQLELLGDIRSLLIDMRELLQRIA